MLTTTAVEHNIPTNQQSQQTSEPSRRPDLSTFFSTLELIDNTNESNPQNNTHALPFPDDVAAAYRLLANSFVMMGRESDGLVANLADELMRQADNPPQKYQGVPDAFLDGLDRVPKKSLKKDDSCPICGLPFLEDKYPLVVELPCHPDHRFDLDCIRPWLKLNPTCPLDRKDLMKKKEPIPPPVDDDEEEWDDQFA
ncbi:hypothetical protein K490DRAFT_32117 [Saccharata proteae CBS 121410]|uniref:RING-type domain-containing protein n=1 Tax=Saccharata proteae CBS 121410 TaxID=1314787 RepID=A0A9P4I407_9PEZI|nr:hypothetical protein K490DRAFT_32117 [Saccharata proteae CBS 121410]